MQDGIVRIGTVAAIPALLEQFDLRPAAVLGELGLDLKLFQDPDSRISHVTRSQR